MPEPDHVKVLPVASHSIRDGRAVCNGDRPSQNIEGIGTMTETSYFKPELQAYAEKLQAAGFTVYRHANPQMRHDGTPVPAGYFVYSRTVDGVELFGTVQEGDFPLLGQPLEHSMPIRPSREHGSSMWIDVPAGVEPDSVEYAELITRPTNQNSLVGTQRNYRDNADMARRFVPLDRPAMGEVA